MNVFGHPLSTCTRKVITTLTELGLPYELTVVDFAKGEHKQPPHLARQPFGQIPTIEDAGFELYESRAICRYLNEKAGGALVPAGLQGRAEMERWVSVETSNFTPAAMKFIYHHVFKRAQDDAVLATARTGLDAALRIMNDRLGEVPYLAGDAFSIADIGYMPYVEYLMASPVKEVIATHPHVMAWWGRVSERPSWQRASGRAAA